MKTCNTTPRDLWSVMKTNFHIMRLHISYNNIQGIKSFLVMALTRPSGRSHPSMHIAVAEGLWAKTGVEGWGDTDHIWYAVL